MKKVVVQIQELLMKISLHSVGRSFPANIYERKVPKEVLERSITARQKKDS